MKNILIAILLLTSFLSYGQEQKFENWTKSEKQQYQIKCIQKMRTFLLTIERKNQTTHWERYCLNRKPVN